MRTVRRIALALLVVAVLGALRPDTSSGDDDDWARAKQKFQRAIKVDDWKVRRNAYGGLAIYDGADAVDEVLKGIAKEKNDAVVLGALTALGQFVSDEARVRTAETMLKSRGKRKLYLLMAMGMQRGEDGKDALLAVLGDEKDTQAAARAALALGQKHVKGTLPELVPYLRHSEWQMRAAAAQAIRMLPGPPPPKPIDPKKPKGPWVPEWFDKDEATKRLVEALESAEGVERGHMIEALHRITKQDFGYDLPAWKQYVSGTDPSKIERDPVHPPYFFGLPVWGRRVVLITTTNIRVDQPHPFQDRERLHEICTYPGGRDLAWFKLQTVRQILHAWISRTVEELGKAGDVRFDFLAAGSKIEPAFGKFVSANASSRNKLQKMLDKLPVEPGNDTYTALMTALDMSGTSDGAAWSKGPDQILYATCSIPWLAEIVDPEVVAASVALKAARRMVTVHTVGLDEHPYELLQTVAEKTGGKYLTLER